MLSRPASICLRGLKDMCDPDLALPGGTAGATSAAPAEFMVRAAVLMAAAPRKRRRSISTDMVVLQFRRDAVIIVAASDTGNYSFEIAKCSGTSSVTVVPRPTRLRTST